MGRALSLCLLTLVGCADREAPVWPEEARLEVAPAGAGRVRARWPSASDDRGVSDYVLRVDGRARLTRRAAGEAEIDGLSPGRAVTIAVIARDRAGNPSSPLEAQAEVGDVIPPRFAPGAALVVRLGPPGDASERAVSLEWPPATDDVGVDGYEVLIDGERVRRATEPRASLLRVLDGAEVFEVRAADAAGNTSEGLFSLAAPEPPPEEEWLASADAAGDAFAVRLREVRRVAGARAVAPVERRLRARLRSAGGCYRRALESGPLFDGHLELELELREAGSVREVRVVGASLGRPQLANCMRSVLLRALFAAGAEGRVRVRYDFALR